MSLDRNSTTDPALFSRLIRTALLFGGYTMYLDLNHRSARLFARVRTVVRPKIISSMTGKFSTFSLSLSDPIEMKLKTILFLLLVGRNSLLPRGHPMKYADSSAFNRSALGASGSSLPQYSAGGPTSSASSRRRAGGASSRSKRYDDDYDSSVGGGGATDDDWFASRARTASSGGGGGGGGRESKSSARSSNWKDLKAAKGRGLGGAGGSSATHIHFGGLSDSSRDRFSGGGGGSASSSRSYGGHDRSGNGSGYDSPRETWKKAEYEMPTYRRGAPSLLDRD